MPADPNNLTGAKLALRKVVRDYLFDPNVTCVDLGLPEGDPPDDPPDIRVRVHVHRKLAGTMLERAVAAGDTRTLPDEVDGTLVDVLEGTYRPHLLGWRPPARRGAAIAESAERTEPMRGGASISDERHAVAGTLGGKVIDRSTGAEMILSNWHVLVGDWSVRPGQRIYQPGRLDGGVPADTVAVLARDAMSLGLDGAVATLTGARGLVNDQLGLGMVSDLGQVALGMRVAKSGRTSGITHGRVTGVEGTARIRYGYLERIIRKVVTIDPTDGGEVSRPGDSGALWLDAGTNEAVALHFAGSDLPERGLAMDVRAVLAALDVRLDTARPIERRWSSAGREVGGEGLEWRVRRTSTGVR